MSHGMQDDRQETPAAQSHTVTTVKGAKRTHLTFSQKMALKHLITCVVAGVDYLVHPQILVCK
jgi:hypothetical protein